MEKALKVLNNLEKKGLLERYAIGGGIAVLFYTEPVLTYDMDVFCILSTEREGLITLSPIYDYLQQKGCEIDGEHIVIKGIPVQFIPAYNKLVEEALNASVEIKYKQTQTRIVRAEHLMALMLQTYRPKDRERMILFLDEVQLDTIYLEGLLERHKLLKKWHEFRRRYDEK